MTKEMTEETSQQEVVDELTEEENVARHNYVVATTEQSKAATRVLEAQEQLENIRRELHIAKVALVAGSSDIPLGIKQLIDKEQEMLWHDLYTDLNQAQNGYWSIAIEQRIKRIIAIAKAVGVTPWEKCPQTIVSSGLYFRICFKAGLPEPTLLGRVMERDYPPLWSHTISFLERLDVDSLTLS